MRYHELAKNAATALLESRLDQIHPDWTPSIEARPDGLFVVCRSTTGETVEWDVQYWTSVTALRIHFALASQILGKPPASQYYQSQPVQGPSVWAQSMWQAAGGEGPIGTVFEEKPPSRTNEIRSNRRSA